MSDSTPGRYLTRQDLEIVIRRAAELEAEAGSSVPELSEADVIRIAGEVGLSEENIKRALVEHYVSSAGDALLVDRGWISRLCGPSLVTASRTIARPAEECQSTVESHFRENESLRLVRRRRLESLWEPDPGMMASIVRSVDLFGRGYRLAKKARAVELRIVQLDEVSSRVSVTADLSNERGGYFWGLGIAVGGTIAGASGAVAAVVAGSALVAAGAAPVLGGALWVARLAFRRSVDKMRLTLEGLLDRLEHGEPLGPPRRSLRDFLK